MKKIAIIIGCIFTLCIGFGCSKDDEPELRGIVINQEGLITLSVGETIQIEASPVPTDAYYGSFGFWSQTPTVATVTDKGLITAVSMGSARIFVHDTNKKVQRPIAIVVQ